MVAPAKRPAHYRELLAAPVEPGIKQLAGFGLAGFGQAMLEDDVELRVCADVALEVDPEGQRLDIFGDQPGGDARRSEEHTSELQSLMRISYAVFCLKKKKSTAD